MRSDLLKTDRLKAGGTKPGMRILEDPLESITQAQLQPRPEGGGDQIGAGFSGMAVVGNAIQVEVASHLLAKLRAGVEKLDPLLTEELLRLVAERGVEIIGLDRCKALFDGPVGHNQQLGLVVLTPLLEAKEESLLLEDGRVIGSNDWKCRRRIG
jgi:hypothetical protein